MALPWRKLGTFVVAFGFASLGLKASDESAKTDSAAIERGRVAMTQRAHLKKAWSREAYDKAAGQWKSTSAPDPKTDPKGYAKAFNDRYGLHEAPFPNDGLPMGLRTGMDGTGMQIDCMICHGGSIGGTSYVGLGNSTLDLKSLFDDLTRADGRRAPFSPFTLNTTRGTVNAGQIAAFLLSLRNPDWSQRSFPIPLNANLPELDTPAWWLLGRKATMYYDGRTPAESVRTNMQFIMGEKSLDELKALEPTFRDIQAYLKSLKPPKYPFEIDQAKASRGEQTFLKNCKSCHGTYGPDGVYPSRIVGLKVIGTDPARALGLSDGLVNHYNSTWFGENHKANTKMKGYQAPPLDGVWATAPYLHNGSVPTLWTLLKSSERPSLFRRPNSTGFENYDRQKVGWKVEVLKELPNLNALPNYEARFYFDASRFGLGIGGHKFGDKLSDLERTELIEYLKSL
jgi:mono/diheme cytochrome c family protein